MAKPKKKTAKKKSASKRKPAPKTPAAERKKKIVKVPERKKAAKPKPKPTGRPPYQKNEQDERIIKSMIGSGDSEREVARVIGIARNTMRKHYSDHLELARIRMLSAVKQAVYREALKGNPTLLIWVTKTQLGWQEPPRDMRLSGVPDAPPIKQEHVGDFDSIRSDLDPITLVGIYQAALQAAATVH